MSGNQNLTVPCIRCGAPVELRQPHRHDKYSPWGQCPKCHAYHYASYGSSGLQVNVKDMQTVKVRRA